MRSVPTGTFPIPSLCPTSAEVKSPYVGTSLFCHFGIGHGCGEFFSNQSSSYSPLIFYIIFHVSIASGSSPLGGRPAASQPPPQPPLGAPREAGAAGPHPHPGSRSDNCEAVYMSIFRLLYILFDFSRTPGSLYNCGAGFPIFEKKIF